MTAKLMTPDEAFHLSLNEYPLLFASKSENDSRFKVYNHFFNVCGSGLSTYDSFIERNRFSEENAALMAAPLAKYISGELLYNAFTKTKEDIFDQPESKMGRLPDLYSIYELEHMPEVLYFSAASSRKTHWEQKALSPSPYFNKEHSNIWAFGDKLPTAWLKAALWFYEQSEVFFLSGQVCHYSRAVPTALDEKAWAKQISDMESALARYFVTNTSVEAAYQEISAAYETPFTGDIRAFLQLRWDNELKRILAFISETKEMILNEISLRKDGS